MNLRKLELFGFKSFMRKLDIHFSDGITVIVGPNGCGKTNVTDALRWVLGEGNARMLRGEKMEDLIFNGTRDFKPLNVAEVGLTVDNSAGLLPIEFSEVTVSRRPGPLGLLVLLATSLTGVACVSSNDIEGLHRQMGDIQKQIQTLEKRSSSKEEVEKLNQNVATQTSQLLKSNADMAVKLGELTTKMEQLEAKLEDTNRRLSQLSQQIAETQSTAGRLVLICGPDPAAGGADGLVAAGPLPRLVEGDVVGHHQRTGRAHRQAADDVDTSTIELGELLQQRFRGQHDAVADQAPHPRPKDARRHQVEHGTLATDD